MQQVRTRRIHRERLWRRLLLARRSIGVDLEGPGTGGILGLKISRETRSGDIVGVNACADKKVVNPVYVEFLDVDLEQGLALGKQLFHADSEAARCQTLAVSVLLVALCPSRGTGSTSRMFGIALKEEATGKGWNLPSGVTERDLP